MDNLNNKFYNFIVDLLFPKFCLGCRKEGIYLCDDCRHILDISEFDYCLCDKNPIRILPGSKKGKCQRCQNKRLSGLYFALSYKEKPLARKLIHQFKYEPYLKNLSSILANILIEHFIKSEKNTNEIWDNSVLIPVPLDKKRIKWRGYNQSEEIAKELSKILKIPVISNVLIKIKPTKSQLDLSREEREKNLDGSFSVENFTTVTNKKIFLVDDVYTTGYTMDECAKTLRKYGANHIWGIAIAREE